MKKNASDDDLRDAIRPSHTGDYALAFQRLDGLLRKFPTDSRILRWKGNLLEEIALDERSRGIEEAVEERLEEAERCYRAILESKPDDGRALRDLGEALLRRGEIAQSLDLLSRSIEALTRDGNVDEVPDAVGSKVEALIEAEEFTLAHEELRRALERFPESRVLRQLERRLQQVAG